MDRLWPALVPCLTLSLAAPPVAASDVRCVDAVVAAIRAGDPEGTVKAAEQALADEACPAEDRNSLQFSRAQALADIARASGGEAWCRAKDAYAPLTAIADPDLGPAVRAGFEQTSEACAEATAGQSATTPFFDGPMTMTATGLGTAVLVGGGLILAGVLVSPASDAATGPLEGGALDTYLRESEFAAGLYVSGLIVAGVGLGIAGAGWIWSMRADGSDVVTVRFDAGPSGFVVQGRF